MALAWLAAAFLLGVVAGGAINLPILVLIGPAVALVVLAWRWPAGRAVTLSCAAFLCGLARTPHAFPALGPGDVGYYNGSAVQLVGRVSQEPDIRDTGTQLVVDAHQITMTRHVVLVHGPVEVHVPRGETADYGDVVTLTGRLVAPRNGRVPYASILALRGIRSTMDFPALVNDGPSGEGPLDWIVPLRQRLENNMDSWLPEPEAALLIAIVLGAHSASLGDFAPLLVSTGLIHLIAISGIKVALVAGILHALIRRVGLPRFALAASLLLMWFYVVLTGATASGERSAAMWTLVFISAALGRETVAVLSLGVAAALMVLLQPELIWDVGFLMTTFGTMSIVMFSGPLLDRLQRIPSPVREAFGVTVAAQLGTIPIVVYGFHVVSLTGPIANALVLPLLPFLIGAGLLLGICSPVSALAGPVAAIVYGLLHAVVLLVSWLAAVPAPPLATLPAPISFAYYAGLSLVGVHLLRRHHWKPVGRPPMHAREGTLALVAGLSLATGFSWHAGSGGDTRLVWLGSGNSVLLLAKDSTVLIDGSPRPFELLERLSSALPYGTRSIGAILVTDARAGNVAGLREVVKHYQVGEVLDVGAEYPSMTYAAWRADIRRLGIPAYQLRTGTEIHAGTASISALAPDAVRPQPQDAVAMLRIRLGGTSVVYAGIASPKEQLEAVFRPVQLRADMLVLSGKACDPVFVKHVKPQTTDGRACPGFVANRRLVPGQVLASASGHQ